MKRKVIKVKTLFSLDDVTHSFNTMLEKFCSLTKLLMVTAWIRRFTNNVNSNVKLGELSVEEIVNALNFWIKLVQQEASKMEGYQQVLLSSTEVEYCTK